jgi:5S rRNA maturation endonuclease (ribonuclease M5)
MYVSFGGQLTQGQLRAIKNLHDHLSKQGALEVYIGVDMDIKGEEYARMIEQLFPQSKRLAMKGKDFNEQLISRIIKTNSGKGRQRLVGFES